MENSFFKITLPTMALKMLLIVLSLIDLHIAADAEIGACYGTLGNNLPSAQEVISLCKQHNIRSLRIFNPNPSVLQALQGQPISVIVGVPDEEVAGIADSPSLATSWVKNHILNYKKVNFRYISVGNEISPWTSAAIAPKIAPAMHNIYNALTASGLAAKIKVSTVLSMVVMGKSYPPSAGAFKTEYQDTFINPIIRFLIKTNGPFLINVYPYFVYSGQPKDVSLDYALFTSNSIVVTDGGYKYQNLFDAMVDSVHAALEKAGAANLEVVVTETGWPSDGGAGTTIQNAKTYNFNLANSVKKGTPRRPNKAIETYIFDLIDENQKSPDVEKHWGVFLPNKQPKYPLLFN